MKPKAPNTPRGRTPKGKIVKKEIPSEELMNVSGNVTGYNIPTSAKASVEIVKCISFQKFRYSGENRPGKKYQEKEFMTLKLSNLQDKVVRVVIICTDAENRELIHPNGLVGKDCHDGIYDKEYAITKQFFLIKIPYLRTERMKTKKNEHCKILGVLSARASHLPSPYKERCLSQCTNKYATSREKFDTTKVCLGVIVTVESHQGVLNGSLHAISHVVRNASEKTSLSILKLSNDSVPAMTGACIDIFTTEDGPAIEPDKYLVFVSYESDDSGTDHWESNKISPGKDELLYKRVITYQVPPFEPNRNLISPVQATLHLECPQSNQYCSIGFQYVPEGEVMIVDEQAFGGHKRSFMEQDVKPTTKRLRTESYDNDGSTEAIKANLKTKIKARHEIPSSVGTTVYIDGQVESPDREDSSHYSTEHRQQQVYAQDGPVIIHHRDPHTGETSYLLDMDASKNGSGTTTFVDGENQYVIQFQEKVSPNILQTVRNVKGSGSKLHAHPQDLKVVATGYSDAVPANAVLVYTTNGVSPQRVDDNPVEHLLLADGQIVVTHSPDFRQGGKHFLTNTGSSSSTSLIGSSTQIIRRDSIAEKRESSEMADAEMEEDLTSESRRASAQITNNTTSGSSTTPSSSTVSDRYERAPASSPLAIPPIRRMLIPSKAMSSTSPWEVSNGDDSDSDYNIVVKTFEAPNKRIASQSVELKNEPTDEDPLSRRSEIYSTPSRTSISRFYVPRVHIAEKQLHHLDGCTHSDGSQDRIDSQKSGSEESSATAREDSIAPGLTSLDVAEAIANNLPTIKIFEIAEDLENIQ